MKRPLFVPVALMIRRKLTQPGFFFNVNSVFFLPNNVRIFCSEGNGKLFLSKEIIMSDFDCNSDDFYLRLIFDRH